MPEVGLHRDILHCCCVQLSSQFTERNIEVEIQHALRFVRDHAVNHTREVCRALVWRVVDSEGAMDRLGAWRVLNAVLEECHDNTQALVRTSLADKLYSFLTHLISHRWYNARDVLLGLSKGQLDGLTESSGVQPLRKGLSSSRVMTLSAITGMGGVSDPTCIALEEDIRRQYRGIVQSWKRIWRRDVYSRLKEAVLAVERNGNVLPRSSQRYLEVPPAFKDSLWTLRRKHPRPSGALHLLNCFGWRPPLATGESSGPDGTGAGSNPAPFHTDPKLPTSEREVEMLVPSMHPRARLWIKKLVAERGGCQKCDTWKHVGSACPCTAPFAPLAVHSREGWTMLVSPPLLRLNGIVTRMEPGACVTPEGRPLQYVEAVEKLLRYKVVMPLRMDSALDCITELIREELPYDDVIDAFDVVRGTVTGPRVRHALWIHAGYALLPSKTVFAKASDDVLSPTMEKAKEYFHSLRRYREWDQLLASVDTLDYVFRRRQLAGDVSRALDEIRDTNSFFFCLVDGTLPTMYTPQDHARVPEEVEAAAVVKDDLCRACLEPYHREGRCPNGRELWDHSVARKVLEEASILDINYPSDMYLVEGALRAIDQDDRKAKEFRKCELRLAVHLVYERRLPLCKVCHILGHSTRRCTLAAARTFEQWGLAEVDARLRPGVVDRKVAELREVRDERAESLQDALRLLAQGSRAYPSAYVGAIEAMSAAKVPLAAARYATDELQRFLLSIRQTDLLPYLSVLREPNFPEVCLFCDSYYHASGECENVRADEARFLGELKDYGVTLWQFLSEQERYEALLPTEYPMGRDSVVRLVRQLADDYSPGGVGRTHFLHRKAQREEQQEGSDLQPGVAWGGVAFRNSGAVLGTMAGPRADNGGRDAAPYRSSALCHSDRSRSRSRSPPHAGDSSRSMGGLHGAHSSGLNLSMSEFGGSSFGAPSPYFTSPYGTSFSQVVGLSPLESFGSPLVATPGEKASAVGGTRSHVLSPEGLEQAAAYGATPFSYVDPSGLNNSRGESVATREEDSTWLAAGSPAVAMRNVSVHENGAPPGPLAPAKRDRRAVDSSNPAPDAPAYMPREALASVETSDSRGPTTAPSPVRNELECDISLAKRLRAEITLDTPAGM